MIKYNILISLILTSVYSVFSQTSKPLRLEFDAQGEETNFRLIPLQQSGFIVFYPKLVGSQNTKYEIISYSSSFVEKHLALMEVSSNLYYKSHSSFDSVLYILFTENHKLIKENKACLVEINLYKDSIKYHHFNFQSKSEVYQMYVLNKSLGFLNKERNSYTLQLFNLENDSITSIEILNEKGYLLKAKICLENNSLNVLFKKRTFKNQSELILKSYNLSTKMMDSTLIQSTDGQILNNSDFTIINDSMLLVLGSYLNDDEKATSADNINEEESTGIFASIYINKIQRFMTCYNYIDLKSFYRYLDDNEMITLKKKLARSSNSKKKYSVNYKLLLHDVIKKDNQYLLAIETYYPEYRTVSNNTYDYYGRLIPSSYTVFEGYRYQKAFLLNFNSTGKLIWENSMQLVNLIEEVVKEKTQLLLTDDEILMATISDGEIHSKAIYNKDDFSEFPSTRIEPFYRTDQIMSSSGEELHYWYNDFFIACGYQQIKNNSITEKNKRRVFYVNKIAYQ